MRTLITRRRYRGAHRTVAPGPRPLCPAVDPWAGHPLFGFEWSVTA